MKHKGFFFLSDLGKIKCTQNLNENIKKTTQNTFTHCDHLLVSPNHALRQEKAVKINSILDMKY